MTGGCFIPTGAPGRNYLTSRSDWIGKRSEVLPRVYCSSKESDSQSWGGGDTEPVLVPPPRSSYLLTWPGLILYYIHSAGMLPPALNWPLSSMCTFKTRFICLFPLFIPVHANFHDTWQHDPPELPHQVNQVASPQHFTLSFLNCWKALSADGIFAMIHFFH